MATKKFNLAEQIRKEAMNENPTNEVHHNICVKLVEIVDGFNSRNSKGHFCPNGFTHTKNGVIKAFPLSFAVYFLVSKEAHKQTTFEKGYTRIDEKKGTEILKMLKFFGEYNGNTSLSRNDKVVHAVTKYYEKVSPKVKDFKADVEKYWKPYPKSPKTMKEVTIGLHIDEA